MAGSFFLPGIVGSPETYIAVGVATILGSAFKSPITAIIMVMEITNNYAIVLPVMIASVCATLLAGPIERVFIYNIRLIQEGIREVETDFWVPRSRSPIIIKNVSIAKILLSTVLLKTLKHIYRNLSVPL